MTRSMKHVRMLVKPAVADEVAGVTLKDIICIGSPLVCPGLSAMGADWLAEQWNFKLQE